MVRNSLKHGIESRKTREQQGKDGIGHIKISGFYQGNNYQLIFEDDGRGIDSKKLATALTASGKCTQEDLMHMDDNTLLESIFIPGLSTAASADKHGGRGIGMDIIKKKLENIGGAISIKTEPGKFTKFILTIPNGQASLN
jgi:chemotaxis protein histidine kinase CheA